MEKEFSDEKRRRENEEPEYKNEYVENSTHNESNLDQWPTTGINECDESDEEPNGIDPKSIFEKGYSFQETPEEIRSQKMNHFGNEPNGIDPKNK